MRLSFDVYRVFTEFFFKDENSFYRPLSGFIGIDLVFIEIYWVVPSFGRFYWVLPDFIGLCRLFSGLYLVFTWYYRVLLNFIGFYQTERYFIEI